MTRETIDPRTLEGWRRLRELPADSVLLTPTGCAAQIHRESGAYHLLTFAGSDLSETIGAPYDEEMDAERYTTPPPAARAHYRIPAPLTLIYDPTEEVMPDQ